MFSFAGDWVLDPFMGQGSTNVAAISAGRNSIGNELEKKYFQIACEKVRTASKAPSLFGRGEAIVKVDESRRAKRIASA